MGKPGGQQRLVIAFRRKRLTDGNTNLVTGEQLIIVGLPIPGNNPNIPGKHCACSHPDANAERYR